MFQYFNGDGKTDLLLREDSGYVATWEMDGAARVQNWFGLVPAAWDFEGTGDFNGDGKSDLLLRENNGYVATWEMDGAAHVQNLVWPGAGGLALRVTMNGLPSRADCRHVVCPENLTRT